MDLSYKTKKIYLSPSTSSLLQDTKNFFYKSIVYQIIHNTHTTVSINYKHERNYLKINHNILSKLSYIDQKTSKSKISYISLENSKEYKEYRIMFFSQHMMPLVKTYYKNYDNFIDGEIKDKMLRHIKNQRKRASEEDINSHDNFLLSSLYENKNLANNVFINEKKNLAESDKENKFEVPDDPDCHIGGAFSQKDEYSKEFTEDKHFQKTYTNNKVFKLSSDGNYNCN